mgnify:CR=1 FL=1
MKTLFKIIGILIADLLVYFYQGFVFTELYGWFLVKYYNAPIITIWVAAGLIMMFEVIHKANQSDRDIDLAKYTITNLIKPTVILGFGAFINFWVM